MLLKLKYVNRVEMLQLAVFSGRQQDHRRHVRFGTLPNGQPWTFWTVALMMNSLSQECNVIQYIRPHKSINVASTEIGR
jgi:hypothetical protein